MPLKLVSAEPKGLAGAGAGKLSPPVEPSERSVGRNVPKVRLAAGNAAAAASDKVNVTSLAAPLPQSDINMTFWPAGPTSSTSTSAPQVWVRFRSVTVTLLRVPIMLETLIVEGYGVAAPESLIVMEVAFVTDLVLVGMLVMVSVKLLLALNCPSLTTTVTAVTPDCPAAGVTVTVRLEPLPPKAMLPGGTSVAFAAEPLTVRLPAGVFASLTVNGLAAVGVPSVVDWFASALMTGGELLPDTVSTKVSLVLFGPSLTVKVMVEVPVALAAGVTVTVRFELKPPNTMLLVGTKVGFDDPALNCRFAAATCVSPMVKASGPAGWFMAVLWFTTSEIVGGVSVVPQLGNSRTSRTVASPFGSVTVRTMR